MMIDVAVWVLWQNVEPLDVHPGWWFGAFCIAVSALFGVITKMIWDDRKERRSERDEARADRANQRQEISDLTKFHREYLLGMIKNDQDLLGKVSNSLDRWASVTEDLTREVRADRLERKADREQRSSDSGIHNPPPRPRNT